jgi:hypothetical protein
MIVLSSGLVNFGGHPDQNCILVAYHLDLRQQAESSFGYSHEIGAMSDVAINLTDATTNQAKVHYPPNL